MGPGPAELHALRLLREAHQRTLQALRRDRRGDAHCDHGEEPHAALPGRSAVPGRRFQVRPLARGSAMKQPETALIVGAGSGLSASLARLFSKEGMRVAVAARNSEKLGALCAETGAKAFA